ncbi:MAG TPA: cell division protein FtsL [Coxiellaceae bacterium]|nr:cell division protein FtsL [Coxiellaceae bacterium]
MTEALWKISLRSTGRGVLISSLLISAFATIYAKDLHRRLFIQLQSEQKQMETLKSDRSRLLLEQATWSSQVRIQHLANSTFNMVSPQKRIYLKHS